MGFSDEVEKAAKETGEEAEWCDNLRNKTDDELAAEGLQWLNEEHRLSEARSAASREINARRERANELWHNEFEKSQREFLLISRDIEISRLRNRRWKYELDQAASRRTAIVREMVRRKMESDDEPVE